MTKKKKLGILATALSLVVCVALGGLLWWEMNKPERIEIPVPGLSWGMSAAEVEAVLADAGIENAKVNGITELDFEDVRFGSIKLSAEEVQKLGAEKILGLPFSSQRSYSALLRFAGSTESSEQYRKGDGILRLAQVELWVEVPEGSSYKAKEEITAILTRAYGQETLPGCWEIVGDDVKGLVINGMQMEHNASPDVRFSQKDCGIGEVKLVYEGAGYVQYLHGGAFPLPPSW